MNAMNRQPIIKYEYFTNNNDRTDNLNSVVWLRHVGDYILQNNI